MLDMLQLEIDKCLLKLIIRLIKNKKLSKIKSHQEYKFAKINHRVHRATTTEISKLCILYTLLAIFVVKYAYKCLPL